MRQLLTLGLFLCALVMKGQAVTDVSTFGELQTALAGSSYIRIAADITVTSRLAVPNGTTIDGDGHVLSVPVPYLNEDGSLAGSPSSFGVFYIESSSIVTLRNMKLLGGSGYAAVTNYGSLTMENVTMTQSNRGLENSSKTVMNNCNLVRCAAQYGGGVLNRSGGQIVMNNCSFTENRDRVNSGTWGGGGAAENSGIMYLNNTTMSNNLSDECGAAINNYGGTLYIMNSTISGNTAVGSYNYGALRDNSGTVYAVNSIIADNKHISSTGTGTVTESDIKSSGTYINCVLGTGTDNAGTQTNCRIATTDGEGIFAEYYDEGMYANDDSYTIGFSRTVLVKDGDSYSAPISSEGLAADGATQSYFNSYIDASGNLVITMCYNNGTEIVSLIPSGSTDVTDLTPNKNDNDPIGAGAVATPTTRYYTIKRGNVENGTMTGISLYGDSYIAGTSVTVEATPASGYAFVGWSVDDSEMVISTSNPYTFEVLQDMKLSPQFGLISQTIVATVEPFVGVYDGNEHNIAVNVTTPSDGYTITYSKTENGEYTSTPPSISDPGVYNVYYKIEAPGYNTLHSFSTVSITGAYAVLSSDNTTLTFYYDANMESHSSEGKIYTATQFRTSSSSDSWGEYANDITTLAFNPSFADYTGLTSTAYWFYNCQNLAQIVGMENLKTDNVTNMSYMFNNCSSLTSLDLTGFNTEKVTSMSYMFFNCKTLTSLDVSEFNTEKVTDMQYMFYGCNKLISLAIGSDFTFGTTTDTEVAYMFGNCTALASGTLMVNGTTAPNFSQDIFSNVFTDGTLVVEGGVTMKYLGVGSADEGSYTYTTWKGGRFNKTFFRDFAFTTSDWQTWYGSEDLTANTAEMETYVVTDVTDNSVTLRETDGEIYQNTPMLLKRKDNTMATVRGLAPASALSSPTDASPYYIGGVSDLSGYDNVYVLAGSEFVKADLSGDLSFNPKRCFITLRNDTPAGSRLRIAGDTTGIESISTEDTGEQWYSIGGQKLSGKPSKKGLYIHNGRKKLVK